MDVRFELSAYEYTIFYPPGVKVILGHPRSSEVTDLGWPFTPKVKIRVIWTVLSRFDNDSLALVGFIASARSPSQLTKFGCLTWPEVTGWSRIIKLDTIGFLSLWATRSIFPRSSRTIRGWTAGGSNGPPLQVRCCKKPHTGESWICQHVLFCNYLLFLPTVRRAMNTQTGIHFWLLSSALVRNNRIPETMFGPMSYIMFNIGFGFWSPVLPLWRTGVGCLA